MSLGTSVIDNDRTKKSVSPSGPVSPGTKLTYTIEVNNASTDHPVTGVRVSDSLPPHTAYKFGSLVINSKNQEAATLPDLIVVPDIDPRGRATIKFDVQISDDAPPGTITNTAAIFADGLAPITRSVSNTTTSHPVLDNSRTLKTVSPTGIVLHGGTLTYTILLENNGTGTAREVKVRDTVPAGTTYVFGSLTVGGDQLPALGLPDLIPVPDIPPRSKTTILYKVTVNGDAAPGTITNTAAISAAGVAEFTRSASSSLSVDAVLDSKATEISVSPSATAVPGQTLRYTISVHNSGTATATEVRIRNPIPQGITYRFGTLNTRDADVLPAVIEVPDIPAKTTAKVIFELVIDVDEPPLRVTNTAHISASGIKEFSRSSSNSVSVNPVLDSKNTFKSVKSQSTVERGSTIEHTLTIRNDGTAPARGVTVKEALPPNTVYEQSSLLVNNENVGELQLPATIQVPDIPPKPESTEGGRRVSVLKRQEGAPVLLG